MTYYLGVDAGGSHCRCRIADAGGAALGSATAGGANARIGLERLHAILTEVTGRAIAAAGLNRDQIGAIRAGMGLAGTNRPGVLAALETLSFPFASVRYDTDATIANLGAHGGRDGAILILGTGSVAQIRRDGAAIEIGGYGFPISDEGSGAAMGLSVVRHALRTLDGRTPPTPLAKAVAERFGRETSAAVDWMDHAAPKDYAAFAPLVMDYADAGDAIARMIVEDAAQHIERFIETIFERGATRCALAGGLAGRIRPWLRARTVARLCEPLGDPLSGALYLAGLNA